MQLTTIALATILISSLATGSKDISPSLKARMAAFQVPEEVQPGPGVRGQPPTGSKKTTISAPEYTPSSKSSVRTFPSSVERGKEFAKPTPTREPTATSSHPKPAPAPKTPVAPTSAKPVASKSAAGPLKPAPVLSSQPKPSERFGGTQEPQGSNVAELRKKFGSSPSSTSASASRSAPRPPVKTHSSSATTAEVPERPIVQTKEPITEQSTYPTIILGPGTPPVTPEQARLLITREPTSFHSASEALPKVSGVSPIAIAIPEDKEFVNFKKAIEQGNYSGAKKIVEELPKEKSREPYGKYLASFGVSEILDMVRVLESLPKETSPGVRGEYHILILYSEILLGLFLAHADDEKFEEFLGKLDTETRNSALRSSIRYGGKLSIEGFMGLFRGVSEEELPDALWDAARSIFNYNTPEFFDELVAELHKKGILKDSYLVNAAFNFAFVEACSKNDIELAQKYFRQAKILSWIYVQAMIVSYNDRSKRNDTFDWLLENAGGDDLKVFLENDMNQYTWFMNNEMRSKVFDRYKKNLYKIR